MPLPARARKTHQGRPTSSIRKGRPLACRAPPGPVNVNVEVFGDYYANAGHSGWGLRTRGTERATGASDTDTKADARSSWLSVYVGEQQAQRGEPLFSPPSSPPAKEALPLTFQLNNDSVDPQLGKLKAESNPVQFIDDSSTSIIHVQSRGLADDGEYGAPQEECPTGKQNGPNGSMTVSAVANKRLGGFHPGNPRVSELDERGSNRAMPHKPMAIRVKCSPLPASKREKAAKLRHGTS